MQPSREKIAEGRHHEFSREKGYEPKPYEHQEYPKDVKVGEETKTVNSAEEEDNLRMGVVPPAEGEASVE